MSRELALSVFRCLHAEKRFPTCYFAAREGDHFFCQIPNGPLDLSNVKDVPPDDCPLRKYDTVRVYLNHPREHKEDRRCP